MLRTSHRPLPLLVGCIFLTLANVACSEADSPGTSSSLGGSAGLSGSGAAGSGGTTGAVGSGGAISAGGTMAAGGAIALGGAAGAQPTGAGGGGQAGAGQPGAGGASTAGGSGGVSAGAAGASGASGSGGGSGSGGAAGAGTGGAGGSDVVSSDCNSTSDQPVIEVSKSGSADFSTVQAALDSLPGSNGTPTIIRIAPGTYTEKLVVNRSNVTLCGQSGQEENTLLTYGDGADTSNGNGGTLGTSGSTSVEISGDIVSAENLTFENSRGPGTQAVAVRLTGEQTQFRNCRFLGYQDTLYVHSGTQYFRDCYVEGTVDFIFGGATAVFDGCQIHSVGGGTALTAPSTDEAVPFGIVFLGGQVTSDSSVGSGSVALGRNWRPYGSTTFIGVELGSHISAVGWVPMGENTLATARFSEYQSSGAGANPGGRASESNQLSSGEAAQYSIDNIFGAWTPSFSE